MKTYLCLALSLISLPLGGVAQHKYGFLAASDETLLAKVQDPEFVAVILGCVYKLDPPPDPAQMLHPAHVTVIESYKGPLAMGQKITVMIPSEGAGPPESEEVGRLRFFFLQKCQNGYAPKDAYACEPVDMARYDADFGKGILSLLRKNNP